MYFLFKISFANKCLDYIENSWFLNIIGGAQLIFVYLPEAIAKLPVAPIYSILYFAMIMAIILTTMASFLKLFWPKCYNEI